MDVIQTSLADLKVVNRLRPIDKAVVKKLAASMKADGLKHPIHFRQGSDFTNILVAGAHRVAAAKALGWTSIDAVLLEGVSEHRARIWECDENLLRSELTKEQRQDLTLARKKAWEAEKKNTAASCATNQGRGRPKGFAAETAEATGRSKSQIDRDVAAAEVRAGDRPAPVSKRQKSEDQWDAHLEEEKALPKADTKKGRDYDKKDLALRVAMGKFGKSLTDEQFKLWDELPFDQRGNMIAKVEKIPLESDDDYSVTEWLMMEIAKAKVRVNGFAVMTEIIDAVDTILTGQQGTDVWALLDQNDASVINKENVEWCTTRIMGAIGRLDHLKGYLVAALDPKMKAAMDQFEKDQAA